ncbi:membrane-associated transporter protein-like [Dysidea avara]|uniref:membrane-associated transporter protein-like n=1 Tax=Dysidea avara TaxID=196820 RepID=UPI003319A99D
MTNAILWLRVAALNSVWGIVDVLYAVEGAYFVPAIYDKGFSPIYGSMLLCFSPILGILFQSYLGSASDRCNSRFGRRRPFILALTISCIAGLIVFPFTKDITDPIQDKNWRFVVLLILVVIATTLVDFGAGSLQSPAKAYLLDVLPIKHNNKGNIISSFWISGGAVIGFAIGAIEWSPTLDTQVKIVCGLSLLVIAICLVFTLCSFSEQRIGDDSTPANSAPSPSVEQISNHPEVMETEITDQQSNKESGDCDESVSRIEVTWQSAQTMRYMSVDNMTILPYGEYVTSSALGDAENSGCFSKSNFLPSLAENIHFIYFMSSHMWILCFSFFFGFLAILSQTFFFTDYVADFIYEGDVTADENSTEYKNYTEGVRIGSLAFGVSALSSLLISLLLGPLIRVLGKRLALVTSYVVLMLQSGIMIVTRNVIVLFVLSPAMFYTTIMLLTIPFILVSEYDTYSILLRKVRSPKEKNLSGRACSILIIAFLSSQVVALLSNGPMKSLIGGAESVMVITSVSSFIGAIIACFVTVPFKCKKKDSSQ